MAEGPIIRARAVTLFEAGADNKTIAKECKVSVATVKRWKNEWKAASPTATLPIATVELSGNRCFFMVTINGEKPETNVPGCGGPYGQIFTKGNQLLLSTGFNNVLKSGDELYLLTCTGNLYHLELVCTPKP